MGKETPDKGSEGLEVGVEGVAKVKVGVGFIDGIAKSVKWIAYHRDAKVQVTKALTERVAHKISEGKDLTFDEQALIGLVFLKHGRALHHQQELLQRTEEVLGEVESRIKLLPPMPDGNTTTAFIERWRV